MTTSTCPASLLLQHCDEIPCLTLIVKQPQNQATMQSTVVTTDEKEVKAKADSEAISEAEAMFKADSSGHGIQGQFDSATTLPETDVFGSPNIQPQQEQPPPNSHNCSSSANLEKTTNTTTQTPHHHTCAACASTAIQHQMKKDPSTNTFSQLLIQ